MNEDIPVRISQAGKDMIQILRLSTSPVGGEIFKGRCFLS